MVEVNFGVGYGPVSLNYEDVETVDGFTLDWLVGKFAVLPEDSDEWFPFFAYCRNAGHIIDDYEANRIWAKFDGTYMSKYDGSYIRYHTVANWASPITFLEVSPDAPAGELQKALDTIIEFADGSADYAREESLAWRDFVYDEIADLVEREVDYDEERWTEWYTDWLFENNAYVIDGGGLSFDLDNARAALEAESERRFEERNQPS